MLPTQNHPSIQDCSYVSIFAKDVQNPVSYTHLYPRREVEIIPEDIPLEIPYEDDDLLIVNKPAGLVVHPGHGNYSGTLVNALTYHPVSYTHLDRQRHRREAAAAPHVEDTGTGIERTDLGNGERMQHMAQVELVEILARDDVDLGCLLYTSRCV